MSANDERYWDQRLETLPPDDLTVVQDHRLQWQMQRCWLGSPFYRERMQRAGVRQRDVKARADLARLPILTDRDLRADRRANPPLGSATVAPTDWWVEQQPLDEPADGSLILTDGDVIHRAGLAARALWALGARPGRAGPVIEVRSPGPAARIAAEAAIESGLGKIGPGGPAVANTPTPPRATWHMSTPAGGIRAPGVGSPDPFLVLGHPRIGPMLAFECSARTGLHWPPDHYLIEVVDPATLTPLPAGRPGALLVTHLTREGSPLVRYWTGYAARLDLSACPCGRTGARSASVLPARPVVEEG